MFISQEHSTNSCIWPYANWEQKVAKENKGRSPFGKKLGLLFYGKL